MNCEDKRRYVSRKKAIDALKSLHRAAARRKSNDGLAGLHYYWCEIHECYHVGHSSWRRTAR